MNLPTPAMPRGRARLLAASVASVATLSLLVGCGSSDSGSGSSAAADPAAVSAAKEATQTAYAPPAFKLAGTSFDASKASGKSAWYVASQLSIPIEQVNADALKESLGLAGVKLNAFDGKADVTQFVQGVQNAIAAHADVIILGGIDPSQISGAISEAKKAGIPVVAQMLGDADMPLPDGVAAHATYGYTEAGQIMANWIAAKTEGKGVGIELITSDEAIMSAPEKNGFKATLKAGCPACKVYEDNVPIADWSTKIQTQVNSTLNAHPDIEYVVPLYDGMSTFAVPGIRSAGKSDVKVISFNATLSVMQNLAKGDTIAADLGSPQAWLGWASADQALRLLAGEQPLPSEEVGMRLFDATNIKDIDLTAPESQWYNVDFKSEYEKLWGLS